MRYIGTPFSRDQVCPMVVVGLVGYLIDTKGAKNPEQAFGRVEFGLTGL